jgi:hypothetical protein
MNEVFDLNYDNFVDEKLMLSSKNRTKRPTFRTLSNGSQSIFEIFWIPSIGTRITLQRTQKK